MRRAVSLLAVLGFVAAVQGQRSTSSLSDIQNVIVIYQDGWSFDSLYRSFPGANLTVKPHKPARQTDKNGKDYSVLPFVPAARLPANLPPAPFDLLKFIKPDQATAVFSQRFNEEQLQIANGKMDRFVAWHALGGMAMSYYDGTDFPEGRLAQEFTLADNFFHAAFGGGFLNRFWAICACTPTGPKGYVVDPDPTLPPQTAATIGDRLTSRNISWRWYADGHDHQSFAYFEKYADGTAAKEEFLKDGKAFFEDLSAGGLPSVSFIKLPGQDSVMRNQEASAYIVKRIRESAYWTTSAIFIVYDDNGGRWDHVAPPKIDRWGPGTRVPAIIISPFAKKHYVDHTLYDTTSILAFIERRWNLRPVASRDAHVNDLTSAFEFSGR